MALQASGPAGSSPTSTEGLSGRTTRPAPPTAAAVADDRAACGVGVAVGSREGDDRSDEVVARGQATPRRGRGSRRRGRTGGDGAQHDGVGCGQLVAKGGGRRNAVAAWTGRS